MSGTPELKKTAPLITPEKRQRPFNKKAQKEVEKKEEEFIVNSKDKSVWSNQADIEAQLDAQFKTEFCEKLLECNEKFALETSKIMSKFIKREEQEWTFEDQQKKSLHPQVSSRTVTEHS